MLTDEAPGGNALFSFYDKETGPVGTQPKIVICLPAEIATETPSTLTLLNYFQFLESVLCTAYIAFWKMAYY